MKLKNNYVPGSRLGAFKYLIYPAYVNDGDGVIMTCSTWVKISGKIAILAQGKNTNRWLLLYIFYGSINFHTVSEIKV